eukprot:m51a1_g9596 hypothetical protein (1520) ;mRNA; r:1034033-1039913
MKRVSSVAAPPHTNNYPLLSLSRVLRVSLASSARSLSSSSSSALSLSPSPTPPPPATSSPSLYASVHAQSPASTARQAAMMGVGLPPSSPGGYVAHGGGGRGASRIAGIESAVARGNAHTFIATALASNDLILRYVGESRVPILKHLHWSEEPGENIVGMSFDPTAQWLLVVTANTTLTLLPAYFLCCKHGLEDLEPASSLSPQQAGPTMLKNYLADQQRDRNVSALSPSRPHVVAHAKHVPQPSTCCVWWKPFDRSAGDFGIIGSATGQITFINLMTGEDVVNYRAGKTAVQKITIVCDPRRTFKYAIVQMDGAGGYYKLPLEFAERNGTYRTIFTSRNGEEFALQPLRQFPPTAEVSVQEARNGPVVGVFNRQSLQLEVYDTQISKYPLFVYQMPPGTVGFHYTKNLTYALVEAGPSAGDPQSQSCCSIVVISNLIAGTSTTQKVSSKLRTSAAMQRFSIPADEHFCGTFGYSDSSDALGEPYVRGCFVWTTSCIYRLSPCTRPETIFFQLVAQGLEKSDAEDLGKTLGLDLFSLYEQAADSYFAQREYGRALGLYSLSNVRASKLVLQFLEIGRLDIAVTHLSGLLHQPDALPGSDRRLLSNILFRCYVLRLLPCPGDCAGVACEFEKFITGNADFDESAAMQILLAHGYLLVKYLLLVAHARRRVGRALDLLAMRGLVHLPTSDIKFLMDNGYTEDLKCCRPVFESLPPTIQAKLILSDVSTVPRHFAWLMQLLPSLDRATLRDVSNFFDPSGPNVSVICTERPRMSYIAGVTAQERPPPLKVEDATETHLTALMLLAASSASTPSSLAAGCRNSALHLLSPRVGALARPKTSSSAPPPAESVVSPQPRSPAVLTSSCDSCEDFVARTPLIAAELSDSLQSPRQSPAKRVVQLCCGSNHSVVLTGTLPSEALPRRVDALARCPVTRVAAGGSHSLAITRGGGVYSWGLNTSERSDVSTLPRRAEMPNGEPVQQIACGYAHTLFLTESGQVLACGLNDHGQLGIGSTKSRTTATPIQLRDAYRAAQVACGHAHSCLCTEAGDVYSWGSSTNGQLGHGDACDQSVPTLVDALHGKRIVSHQLGHGEPVDVPLPRLMQTLHYKRIVSVGCGRKHTICACESGEVYAWGSGDKGVLGRADTACGPLPKTVPGLSGKQEQVIAVSCGESFNCAATASGKVFTWGANTHGQLGDGGGPDSASPTEIEMQLVVPSSSSPNEGAMGMPTLLMALRAQWGSYRPATVLQRASALSMWEAVAAVHELAGDHQHALAARLRLISEKHASPESEAEAVLGLVRASVPRMCSEGGHVLLQSALEHWWSRSLPAQPIVAFLESQAAELAGPLGALMAEARLAPDGSEPAWMSLFPRSQRLAVAALCLAQLAEQRDRAGDVPLATLWAEILGNLPRDAGKRDVLFIPLSEVQATARQRRQEAAAATAAAPSSADGGAETVAFTCGHQYRRKELATSLLPHLAQLAEGLQQPVPIAVQLAADEYKQRSVALACPVCLYNNFFRGEHHTWRP